MQNWSVAIFENTFYLDILFRPIYSRMLSRTLLNSSRSVFSGQCRAISVSVADMSAIKNVTVIGAGLMGSGIAQVSAQAGYNVTMVDQTEELLEKSHQSLEKSLTRVAKKKYPDDLHVRLFPFLLHAPFLLGSRERRRLRRM